MLDAVGPCIAVGLDARGRTLQARGWTEEAGDLFEAIDAFSAMGVPRFVYTDVAKDGMLAGPQPRHAPAGRRRHRGRTSPPPAASPPSTTCNASPACHPRVDAAIVGKALYADAFTLRGGARGDPCHCGRDRRPLVSLAARVIPCLDVTEGRVVKGINFVDLRDAGDPVELGAVYDREGADELVFLDITASSDDRDTMVDVVERVASQVGIPFAVGGGIRTVDDARRMLRAGADKVAFNTAAVQRPEVLTEAASAFGSQSVVAAVDARRRDPDDSSAGWEITIHGGRTDTGVDALSWCVEVAERGAGEILLTSMDRDGTKQGFDLDLLRAVTERVDVPVIASGGAGTAEHMAAGILEGHASAVLAASIFHFGELRISEVKDVMAAHGAVVRRTGVAG